MSKICSVCGLEFDGKGSRCDKCLKEYKKQWYDNNKEHIQRLKQEKREQHKQYMKEYHEKNKEREKEYRSRKENRERGRENCRKWYRENIEHCKQYHQNRKEIRNQKEVERRQKDKRYRMDCRDQGLIKSVLSGKSLTSYTMEQRFGYTAQQLREHFESLFTSKMNWDNYGSYWECDHIKPKAQFNYQTEQDEEYKQCWALSNLRPLEYSNNRQRLKKDF